MGIGADDCDLLFGAGSGFFVFDRRGGGTTGFGSLSPSSCISFADLKDEGEDGSTSLPFEVEVLGRVIVVRLMSADCGRAWRVPRCGGGFGGGGVPVLNAVN
jgi:hypothetical protein